MTRLLGYDLTIESMVTIPGAISTHADPAAPSDLHIRLLRATPAIAAPMYRRDGDDVVFSPRRGAVYRCGSDEIAVAPYVGADQDLVGALAIATALPTTLWLRGRFVLHAAALRLPGSDRALAIAGPSGSGKSTVAADALARGAELVADDTLSLDISASGIAVSGLAGGYHRVDQGSEVRMFQPVASPCRARRLPLGAVVTLSPTRGTSRLVRLDPLAAMQRLLANQHRPRIPALLGRRAEVLQACALVAETVPVYTWQRRHGALQIDAREWDALSHCI